MKARNRWLAIVLALTALTVIPRLYRLNAPIADWHSWRQVDTAAVARNFVKFGFDPLRPRYDDLSNIQSGKDNPQGWRMVEFPLYQGLAYAGYRIWPGFTVEVWLRLISIAATALTAVCLTLLLRSISGTVTALSAGVLYALLPYSVYYGRTTLPEPTAVAAAMVSVYLAWQALSVSHTWRRYAVWIAAGAAASAAVLVKPTAAFLLGPLVYIGIRQILKVRRDLLLLGFTAAITLVPLLMWRRWIAQFPEGIPAYQWLLNEGNIRFKGAWFYWLWAKRLAELILGYWGVTVFGLGLAARMARDERGILWSWLGGMGAYWVIIARGNVQHDYYQIIIMPVVCAFAAKGIAILLAKQQSLNRFMAACVTGMVLLFTLAFSWYSVRTYYWINRPEIVEAGRHADALLPKDAKVIASYNGDTTFLYQINRQGWPLGFEIDKKIAQGATHYVTVSPGDADGETRALAATYTVLVRNDRYAIIDLRRPQSPLPGTGDQ